MTSIPQCGSVWPSVAAVPLSRAESLWLSPASPTNRGFASRGGAAGK